jgi:hypothetical protein
VAGGTPGAGEATPGGGGFSLDPIVGFAGAVVQRTQRFLIVTTSYAVAGLEHWRGFVSRGVEEVSVEPAQVYHTYVRSDHTATRATATDLSLLETTPVLGALVAMPLVVWFCLRSLHRLVTPVASPVRQTDVLAVAYVVSLALFNLDRLPLHAMWTVRYLVSLVPIGLYLVGRLEPVRRVVLEETRLLLYSYTGLVLVGGQMLVVYLVTFSPTRGEALQLHGILGLLTAAVVSIWAVGTVLNLYEDRRVGAVAVAIPLASGSLFVLLTGLEYFVVGHFGIAVSEIVSDAIPLF